MVPCYINEADFDYSLKKGAGCQENPEPTFMKKRIKFSLPSLSFALRGQGWRRNSVSSGQWFKESWLCDRASIKSPKGWGLESLQVDEWGETLRERLPLETALKLLNYPNTYVFFLLAVPELCPFYNKLVTVRQMIFWVMWTVLAKLIKPLKEVVGTSSLQPGRAEIQAQPSQLASEVKVGVQSSGLNL